MNKAAIFMLVGMIAAIEADAQASLTPSAKAPGIDGSISAGEYEYSTTVNGIKIGATLGSDGKLYLAVEARTSGWVGLGTGSLAMIGSRLYMGAIRDGKPAFSEFMAAGHGTAPAKDAVAASWALGSSGGATTLELALPSSAAISDGSIKIIFSYAASPDFRVKHRARGSASFAIK